MPPLLHEHVLVTGAAGAIGTAVCRELILRGHCVRGFDLREPSPSIDGLDDMLVGNLADADAVERAVAGMDAVAHLAAYPDEADFLDDLLEPNVIGVYHLLEATLRHQVRRVIVTSSCQTIEGHDWDERCLSVDEPFAPLGHYAVTKAMAEAWARYYAQQHGMSMIVVRPGMCPRDRSQWEWLMQDELKQRVYLSHTDAGRFYALCVEVPDVRFALLYGYSRCEEPYPFDLEPARTLLGYEPVAPWSGVPDGVL